MTRIITKSIWKQLTAVVKKTHRPAHVAVAFFSQGAAKRLPLPKGSRLVVNANEHTVKTGLTCPAELKELVERGVRVYSIDNLHAKVFVLGRTVFIGSANVSQPSAKNLVEAVAATTEPETVGAARQFIRDLCLHELGPEELDRLQAMYRPPKIPGNAGKRKPRSNQGVGPALRRVLLAQLVSMAPPEGSESTEEAGREIAKSRQKKPRRHVLEDFWWTGQCPYKRGDTVVQVWDRSEGHPLISPPGNVVHTRVWRGGGRRCTFIYVELPKRRRIALDQFAKRLGRGAKKKLQRGGRVSNDFAKRLLAAWNQ
jgi:hypothetical protein